MNAPSPFPPPSGPRDFQNPARCAEGPGTGRRQCSGPPFFSSSFPPRLSAFPPALGVLYRDVDPHERRGSRHWYGSVGALPQCRRGVPGRESAFDSRIRGMPESLDLPPRHGLFFSSPGGPKSSQTPGPPARARASPLAPREAQRGAGHPAFDVRHLVRRIRHISRRFDTPDAGRPASGVWSDLWRPKPLRSPADRRQPPPPVGEGPGGRPGGAQRRRRREGRAGGRAGRRGPP